jgi:glyoxylase-like metal-dependent hydrolase (beta-lactamase superfamily II)/rhodanese-related sulfurtransferase
MTREIDVDTLRQWLDEHRQIAVLDVRTNEDRAQWWIPGSRHIDASEALGHGEAGPLATLPLPANQPIVTVCGAGRVSRVAADLLSARGLDAHSLVGGMKAWSLAWNTADVPLPGPDTHIVQVRRTGKGCLSYIVGSRGEAAVIDASLPGDVYLDLARDHGWQIRYVIDTHVHADHLSRSRQLATDAGAALLLPQQERVRFPHAALSDGDRIAVGDARFVAHRTPGHTLESTSFALNDTAVFTGDTLLTNGVGRPDLHADTEGTRAHARELFRSLNWLRSLPPSLLVLPAHASAPIAFDRHPVAASMHDVDVWLSDWLVSEDSFIGRVVSRLPPTPPHFTRITELNELGILPAEDAADLEAGANRCSVA